MKTLIHTRIYALLTQNESNPSELAHAYEEFIETMTEMVANFDNRDDILRILYYSRVEFDVLSHPSFNRYSNNVLRTTFIYKNMYILDCEINIVSNSTKYSSNQDYSFPLSYQDGELLWTGTQQELLELAVALHYHVRQPQGAFHRDRPCLVFYIPYHDQRCLCQENQDA